MNDQIARLEPAHVHPWRVIAAYAVMLAAAVALFFVIRAVGEAQSTPAIKTVSTTETAPTPPATDNALFHVLLALAAVIVAGRGLGVLFTRLGQPPVIGEVIAGILLGPSLLGRLSPDAMAFLFPSTTLPYLGVLAQLGVILYMFLVGLELNAGLLRARAHTTLAISHASIVAPFLLGAGLALWLHRDFAPAGVSFTSFALFMGVAMAITAFPVLARILTDRGIEKTELGVVALSCAAVDDLTAWCLLAFVVGVARAQVAGALETTLLALGYLAIMFGVVRPLARRAAFALGARNAASPARETRTSAEATSPGEDASRREDLPPLVVGAVLVALLLSALATEAIGVHAIFGAFLLGAVIPHDSAIARVFHHKLEDFITILLLPAFFAYTGMRTQIGLVSGWEEWLVCGVIILAATAGKFGGTFLAARLTGIDGRTSAALGILMNTRGLMELIVLNVGLDLGVISPALFAMMVVMALATTLATTPVLRRLHSSPRAAAQA
jgi:Kef-type K+ transport system membrane component KefB